MQEEFHGIWNDGNGPFKLLYGWGTMSANVWLPSLSELVGYNPDAYNESYGTYLSAMQGLNISSKYYTDPQGGAQWKLFEPYNTTGGGEKIWNTCNQQTSWLRSPHCGRSGHAWAILSSTTIDSSANSVVTLSFAVHPAVDNKKHKKP